MSVTIDLRSVERKIGSIRQFLKEFKYEGLTVALGPTDENVTESDASAFYHWLLGFEFPDTILTITASTISFLSSKKKINILEQLKSLSIETKFFIRDKDNETIGLESIWSALCTKGRIGHVIRTSGSDFASDWLKFIQSKAEALEPIFHISNLWKVKDKKEVDYIIYASQLCEVLFTDVVFEGLKTNFNISRAALEGKIFDAIESRLSFLTRILPRDESVEYFEIFRVNISQLKNIWNVELTCKYKSYLATFSRIFVSSSIPQEQKNQLTIFYESCSTLLRCVRTGLTSAQIYDDICSIIKSKQNAGLVFDLHTFGQSVLFPINF